MLDSKAAAYGDKEKKTQLRRLRIILLILLAAVIALITYQIRERNKEKGFARTQLYNAMLQLKQSAEQLPVSFENGAISLENTAKNYSNIKEAESACMNYSSFLPGKDISDAEELIQAYYYLTEKIYRYGYVKELEELDKELFVYLEVFDLVAGEEDLPDNERLQKRLNELHQKILETGNDFDNCTDEASTGLDKKLEELGYKSISWYPKTD